MRRAGKLPAQLKHVTVVPFPVALANRPFSFPEPSAIGLLPVRGSADISTRTLRGTGAGGESEAGGRP